MSTQVGGKIKNKSEKKKENKSEKKKEISKICKQLKQYLNGTSLSSRRTDLLHPPIPCDSRGYLF